MTNKTKWLIPFVALLSLCACATEETRIYDGYGKIVWRCRVDTTVMSLFSSKAKCIGLIGDSGFPEYTR